MMRLIVIHGFDPRGPKVGGIETHVRQILRHHPEDVRVLLVGIDDFGDLILGKATTIPIGGREIDFVPVLHIPSAEQTGAAAKVLQSATLRFAAGVARHLPALRRMVRGEAMSAEVERYEYAPLARLLGAPLVTINHNEGDPRTEPMDSILTRYWYVHAAAERIALGLSSRVFGVTPRIKERISREFPKHAAKTGVLTVSVDTELFHATPFSLSGGKLKLVYAGRLDAFKNPPLMFRVVKRLHERLNGAFEFHYCGSADPQRFEEFAAIAPFTVRHGALMPSGVAAVMRDCHMGILVSHFEGLPCFLLELLASGRPFAGLRLAQFDQMVELGVSGRMVDPAATEDESKARIVDAVLAQWQDIQGRRLDPQAIHAKILPWSVDSQLDTLFTAHREIARPGGAPRRFNALARG
jgi:glycosyltransferase involved in cell wall biosynthesis